jgi:hypothetical protein
VIPFAAFRTVSRIVAKIMQWQQYPYALDADAPLVEHMTYVVGMTNAEMTLLSTSLEPDVPSDAVGSMSPRLGASSSSSSSPAAAATAANGQQLPPHMRQSVTGSPTASPQPGIPRSNSTSHGRQPIVIEMPPDDAVRPSSPPPPPAEPSATALAAALAAEADTAYPFDEDDTRNNIVLSGGSVHAATLSKLVERLTYDQPVTETVFDIAAFERVFFHQYRMVMAPEALLTLLERRFDVPQPPSATSPADVQKFRLGKQLPIQMKVYNVCHYWAMHFYDDDIGPDAKLEQRFLRFAQRLAQVRGVQDRLTLLLRDKRQHYDQRAPIDRAVTSLAGAEAPTTSAKLSDFTADELARQLSVDHCVLYRSVRLRMMPIGEAKPLASGWPEAALHDALLGPAAGAWQQLRQWTTTCVARDADARVRADAIVRLIDVAQRLLDYANYFAFTAVVHGLASPLVSRSRLPHTWKAVPSRKLDTFVQFAELASAADGFGRVREHMSHACAPTVPHLPTLLYDIAAAEAASAADPPAPMVEFRRLQARANALLPLERFKAPLTSYEWYGDGVRSEAAAAEQWSRAAQHVRTYLGTLDALDNARLAQLVARHGESGDAADVAHADDDGGGGGGGGAGEADENGVIDVPVSPRRGGGGGGGGDPSMSPRGRSKRRGATTSSSSQAQSGPSATELLSGAVRAGYLSKKKRTQLMGRWQKRYFVLSGESLYFFNDPAAERPQNEFKLLTTVVKPSKERLQFELWPAGGGEAYAIMANDDVELIAWMQAISDVCDHAMMRSLYSGGQPVKTVREPNNAPEWRRLLHEVADLPQNRKCVDCSDVIDKATAWASINLGVFICIECSGVHRSLGVTISQVRSVALDEWQLSQIAVMREIGNQNANELWEHTMTPAQKLKPKAPRSAKEAFLRAKYVEKRWYDRSRLNAADEDDDNSAPPPAPDDAVAPSPASGTDAPVVRGNIVTTAAAGGSPLMAARAAPAAPVLQSRPSVPISTASPQAQTYRTPASAPQTAVAAASRRESMRSELLELLRSDAQFRAEVERMLSADLRAQIDEFRRQQEQGLQELRDRLAALDDQQQ